MQGAAADDVGALQNAALEEISGLTRSLRDPQILWGHNDSFNPAVLFRIGLAGEDLGEVNLVGGPLLDWEDIASFYWQGEPALLLADVGDNFAARDHVTLYAVRDPGRGDKAELLWALDLRYPDGARDCEAVAVDEARDEILLLSKRDRPPRLYRLPLPAAAPSAGATEKNLSPPRSGAAREPQIAELLGELRSIPPLTFGDRRREGMFRSPVLNMPTAMDISADGNSLVIVTPKDAYRYRRTPGESWLPAMNRAPQVIALPRLPQIEAGTFSADGRWLFIASEQAPAGFARVALPR